MHATAVDDVVVLLRAHAQHDQQRLVLPVLAAPLFKQVDEGSQGPPNQVLGGEAKHRLGGVFVHCQHHALVVELQLQALLVQQLLLSGRHDLCSQQGRWGPSRQRCCSLCGVADMHA